jgi:hypothetical protein
VAVILDLAELFSRSGHTVQSLLIESSNLNNPPIIIGGFARHLHDLKGFNDIDWLCYDQTSFVQMCNLMNKHFELIAISICKDYFYYKEVVGANKIIHQVHTLPNVGCHHDFLNYADFTVSCIGFNYTTIIKHRLFDYDLKQSILRKNESYVKPFDRSRIKKYTDRGFKMNLI